jgi:hypothetical protein
MSRTFSRTADEITVGAKQDNVYAGGKHEMALVKNTVTWRWVLRTGYLRTVTRSSSGEAINLADRASAPKKAGLTPLPSGAPFDVGPPRAHN